MDKELFNRFSSRYRKELLVILQASSLYSLLVFSGSIYMMLVYDSVLPSRSIPTLFGLFAILIVVYLFQFIFDNLRGEALLGLANGVHDDLAPAVDHAVVSRSLRSGPGAGDGLQLQRDLDQIHAFLSSAGPSAIIDMPWVVVFLLVLFALHWWLGLTALAGVVVMAAIALWTSRQNRAAARDLAHLGNMCAAARQAELRFAETAAALGMEARLRSRTSYWADTFLKAQTSLGKTLVRLGGAGRTFRLLLQSMILTAGALLVIDGKASAGVIIASSVLAGRALTPVDQAIANWRGLSAARAGWARIAEAISVHQIPQARTVTLSRPSGEITLCDVWVVPPGHKNAVVSGVTLNLQPGQALAIIGPSAAGKTSLVKALLGIWSPARGEIRIDGATHDQWDRDVLGSHFGYVPQAVELVEGTIGENIARFDPGACSETIITAAHAAAMHEAILELADGYDTQLSGGGNELSAGQRQRVGLARALYGAPHLVVLDEANSNLDSAGDEALANAITAVRERQGIVVMVTHRPATLRPISHIAVMQGGRLVDYGERDEVLVRMKRQGAATAVGSSDLKEAASA